MRSDLFASSYLNTEHEEAHNEDCRRCCHDHLEGQSWIPHLVIFPLSFN